MKITFSNWKGLKHCKIYQVWVAMIKALAFHRGCHLHTFLYWISKCKHSDSVFGWKVPIEVLTAII